ncbi:hypothetical protein [Pedobacter nutrimenti]|uniref:Uncharacterized protein n=1 Tax=Pedobacter nutrimenti TaxID=1241337 RepID=A0A318U6T7_9SPHI|nr:hypothetical protein [Pedobacter nutrimenti]PYF68880.1 hypothetical protein B0O44_11158 [Pedobacter nutrimenti]
MSHTFHIPVLGLGYSIDTPLKVARYGISSVVSIVDDELTERMRAYHCATRQLPYTLIRAAEQDSRARRITAYLDLLDQLVEQQFEAMRKEDFTQGTELSRYFELLPALSPLKIKYKALMQLENQQLKERLLEELKQEIMPGSIDVNIMSKVDKANYTAGNEYAGDDFTDAIAAMRGFSKSRLHASVIISAGLNPRLYAYMEQCTDFYPQNGLVRKKIILKVSDYRSALIQAKMLAKRGLWVAEFRVESGLNCGGHAFATDGLLMGPILEEFKQKRSSLFEELLEIYQQALMDRGFAPVPEPTQRLSVQGGIGTADEHDFLIAHYELDAAGWGSPFLLVPEATNVDEQTLKALGQATEEDFYLSNSSPLGVLFNNFKKSTAEILRLERIAKGRPGSPCKKKFLCTNTEFTEQPICTASREYQHLKLQQLAQTGLSDTSYRQQEAAIIEKVCLCEGLCASVYLKNDLLKPRENPAVSICPGPNLAYFSGTYSLSQMIGHIYGRENLLGQIERPNLFVKELQLYVEYLKKDMEIHLHSINEKKNKYFQKFSAQLQQGINYYKELIPSLGSRAFAAAGDIQKQLEDAEKALLKLIPA